MGRIKIILILILITPGRFVHVHTFAVVVTHSHKSYHIYILHSVKANHHQNVKVDAIAFVDVQ